MNSVILMGRLTRDPEIRYSTTGTGTQMAIARYTLAVNRRFTREGEQKADFINCVAFGKSAEFAEKYFHKGLKIVIRGRIQTGSYTNRDGATVYTTDVVIEEQNFAESKTASQGGNVTAAMEQSQPQTQPQPQSASNMDPNEFITIPIEEFEDDGLPFN